MINLLFVTIWYGLFFYRKGVIFTMGLIIPTRGSHDIYYIF